MMLTDALAGFDGFAWPWMLLAIVYLLTMVMTEMITNTAVAAIMIPISVAVARQAGYDPRAFILAIALAASLSFLTPVGYQTNLMVLGAGNYRPLDYLRVGLPVAIAVAVTAIVTIPMVIPF